MKYVALFILIEIVNLPLMILGWVICLSPKIPWLWWNDDDGYGPAKTWWQKYVWLAWRNPVSNLRHVAGVSGKGRPLWRKTWGPMPGGFYVMAGWEPNGYPVLSGGRNVNNW